MADELDDLVHELPGLIWVARADGRAEFVNRRWCEYTGLSAEESLGERWQVATHPEDAPFVLERWEHIRAAGTPAEFELRLRRHDGAYRWFLVRSRPFGDADGGQTRWCGIATDIDDRKRTEKELHASTFQQICESIPSLVCSMTPNGDVEVFNRELLDFFGKTAEELRAWGITDAVHPDDRARVVESFTNSLVTGTPYEVEHRCRRYDGVYRWFQVRSLPVRHPEGQITGWFVLLTDIEDKKRAEQALQASERNLKLIINTIPVMAWSTLPDGSADFFNQHYLDYVGMSMQDAMGWGWTAAIHADDLPALKAIWERLRSSGSAGEAEVRYRRQDGVYRWFLIRADPLRSESGEIVKWYGTNTDIDDRKRTGDELRRSQAFLEEGQRLSRTGSFCWGIDSDLVTCSDEFRRIFECEGDAVVTLATIGARIHPDDLPLLTEKQPLARAGVDDHNYEIRLRMPDGRLKYVRTNSYATRDRDGHIENIGAVQDITERRLAEEVLNEVRSELSHMTRVASFGVLTASIAHEVNQPLAGIIMNGNTCMRMLSAEPPNLEGARETARRTIRDANRASEVITRLRALFAKRDKASEPVDLNEAAREVLALSRSELQRARVVLRTELANGLPFVLGDRVQLQQVILNLLSNASAAMSVVDDRPRDLSIRTEREDREGVRLSVRDAGIGIDPQTVARLFEPFYTTKSSGMGLGLSVSRSIVESHRGKLWAEPNEGPGATFCFSIPVQ